MWENIQQKYKLPLCPVLQLQGQGWGSSLPGDCWKGFLIFTSVQFVVFLPFVVGNGWRAQHIAWCLNVRCIEMLWGLDAAGLMHSRDLQVLHKIISGVSQWRHFLPLWRKTGGIALFQCRNVMHLCHRTNCFLIHQLKCNNCSITSALRSTQ